MAAVQSRRASSEPFGLQTSAGLVYKAGVVHKFGYNPAVGTTFVPISQGGIYRTPQAASATTLRVKAGDVADTAAGAGAQAVTLIGLDQTGTEVTETLATAGTSASAVSTNTFMRLYRAYVSASGTYATATAGSHEAAIVIEKGAGSEDWLTISATGFPRAQSEVAVYSVPLGYTAYLFGLSIWVDSGKAMDIVMFKRENILEAAAPYSAMREFAYFTALTGTVTEQFKFPMKFPALTDFGAMGTVGATTGAVAVDMEIAIIKD